MPNVHLFRSRSFNSVDQIEFSNDHEMSFCDYKKYNRTVSESSTEVYIINDSLSEASTQDAGPDHDLLDSLEQKIDELSNLYNDQCRLLTEIKSISNCSEGDVGGDKLVLELLKKALERSFQDITSTTAPELPPDVAADVNCRARALLEALKSKQTFSLDLEIRNALVEFLQSDELTNSIVTSTTCHLGGMRAQLSRDVARVYVPLLQRAQRRLHGHVTRALDKAFIELERKSSSFTAPYRGFRRPHRALAPPARFPASVPAPPPTPAPAHLTHLKDYLEQVLQNELKEWRQEALHMLYSSEDSQSMVEDYESMDYPPSPQQPANPERSIIDQLMAAAEISKQIQDGDINGGFSRALSAGDLALVMAACRAVDPTAVFGYHCELTLPVVLSLVQQLSTDMVHETKTKCRYLEEAVLNLSNVHQPISRSDLTLVVEDVRKNLKAFLTKYPSHLAHKKIKMIIMAVDSLLK